MELHHVKNQPRIIMKFLTLLCLLAASSAALTYRVRQQKRKYVQLDMPPQALPYGSLHDHRRHVSHSSGYPDYTWAFELRTS